MRKYAIFRYFFVFCLPPDYQIKKKQLPYVSLFYIGVKNYEIIHFAIALSLILLYY